MKNHSTIDCLIASIQFNNSIFSAFYALIYTLVYTSYHFIPLITYDFKIILNTHIFMIPFYLWLHSRLTELTHSPNIISFPVKNSSEITITIKPHSNLPVSRLTNDCYYWFFQRSTNTTSGITVSTDNSH